MRYKDFCTLRFPTSCGAVHAVQIDLVRSVLRVQYALPLAEYDPKGSPTSLSSFVI